MQTHLLIIDPQIDFCDPQHGSLYVEGAYEDMRRLSALIERMGDHLCAIHVTLDSHHFVDISHPIFWRDAAGEHPRPFTIITADEVADRRWTTTRETAYPRALSYVRALQANGRYPLCIWPYHCLIGSKAHAVMPELFESLVIWESRHGPVNYIEKGSNIWTEHYSAIVADVPDPDDPSTLLNWRLIEQLQQADRIVIAGEAASHCVANTVRDLADNMPNRDDIAKLVLLTDATSPVSGFEAQRDAFVSDLTERGMQICTTERVLA